LEINAIHNSDEDDEDDDDDSLDDLSIDDNSTHSLSIKYLLTPIAVFFFLIIKNLQDLMQKLRPH